MFGILLYKAIQDELKIDKAQAAKLVAIPNQVRLDNKGEKEELTAKSRLALAEGNKLTDRILKRLAEAEGKVLTKEQMNRLQQLSVQSLGSSAFQDREILALLKLSDKQQESIDKIQKEMTSARTKIRVEVTKEIGQENRGKYSAEVNKRMAKWLAEGGERAAALLFDKQKVLWKKLVGEPSEVVLLSADSPISGGRRFTVSQVLSNRVRKEIQFLESPELAKELKLSQEEASQLKAIPKALQNELGMEATKAIREKGEASLSLSRLESKMAKEARERSLNNVLRPGQVKRLRQIERQREGFTVFEDYEVLDALKLTTEQAEAIKNASKEISRRGTSETSETKELGMVVETFTADQKKLGPK
jgi:hypothetical protein